MKAQVNETDLDYGRQHLGYLCNQKKKKAFNYKHSNNIKLGQILYYLILCLILYYCSGVLPGLDTCLCLFPHEITSWTGCFW